MRRLRVLAAESRNEPEDRLQRISNYANKVDRQHHQGQRALPVHADNELGLYSHPKLLLDPGLQVTQSDEHHPKARRRGRGQQACELPLQAGFAPVEGEQSQARRSLQHTQTQEPFFNLVDKQSSNDIVALPP